MTNDAEVERQKERAKERQRQRKRHTQSWRSSSGILKWSNLKKFWKTFEPANATHEGTRMRTHTHKRRMHRNPINLDLTRLLSGNNCLFRLREVVVCHHPAVWVTICFCFRFSKWNIWLQFHSKPSFTLSASIALRNTPASSSYIDLMPLLHTHTPMHTHIHIHIHTHTHPRTHIHTYTYPHTHPHAHTRTPIHTHLNAPNTPTLTVIQVLSEWVSK